MPGMICQLSPQIYYCGIEVRGAADDDASTAC